MHSVGVKDTQLQFNRRALAFVLDLVYQVSSLLSK